MPAWNEYIATKKEMRASTREGAIVAIQDEIVRLEKDMQKEEEEMHTFQKQNNIGFLKEDGNSAATYLSLLNRQLADLKTEYRSPATARPRSKSRSPPSRAFDRR